MLPCRKHPTKRAEYVNKCKYRGFYDRQKPPSFPKSGKEGRPHPPPNNTKRPPNTTIQPPNAPQVPPYARKPPKFHQTANARRKFLMCKRAKFPHTQNDTPKFPYIPEKHSPSSPPRNKLRFLRAQTSLSSFHIPPKAPRSFTKVQNQGFTHAKRPLQVPPRQKGQRFPYIHKPPPPNTSKIAHSRSPHVQ